MKRSTADIPRPRSGSATATTICLSIGGGPTSSSRSAIVAESSSRGGTGPVYSGVEVGDQLIARSQVGGERAQGAYGRGQVAQVAERDGEQARAVLEPLGEQEVDPSTSAKCMSLSGCWRW